MGEDYIFKFDKEDVEEWIGREITNDEYEEFLDECRKLFDEALDQVTDDFKRTYKEIF